MVINESRCFMESNRNELLMIEQDNGRRKFYPCRGTSNSTRGHCRITLNEISLLVDYRQ